MASRALLQKASSPRVFLHRFHHVSVPSLSLCLPKDFSTRNIKNGLVYNISNYTINNNGFDHTSVSNAKLSRAFSTSAASYKDLSKMSEEEISGLRVKGDRLMSDLHKTCEWGKGERWGR